MRKDDERKILRRQALGKGQVGRNLEPVGGLVMVGLALGERLAGQFLADTVLERQRLRLAVPKIGLARLGIALRG